MEDTGFGAIPMSFYNQPIGLICNHMRGSSGGTREDTVRRANHAPVTSFFTRHPSGCGEDQARLAWLAGAELIESPPREPV